MAKTTRFKIGQEVISIGNIETLGLKQNEIYTISMIKLCSCGCNQLVVDIGLRSPYSLIRCRFSELVFQNDHCIDIECFRPLNLVSEESISFSQKVLIDIEKQAVETYTLN